MCIYFARIRRQLKHNKLYATNGACKLLYGVSGVVNLYIIKLFYYCYTGWSSGGSGGGD